jgi:N-acetylmuramoyl-L-alanine amidase
MMKKLIVPAVLSMGVLLGASPSFAYEVQKGDTMSGIAKKHNMNLETLAELNPEVKDIDLIYIGDNINTKEGTVTATETNKEVRVDVVTHEEDLLARLVEAEANGESYAGKVAVAYVVLNRVDSADFPNSITEVIYQNGQFSPVSNGSINREASPESMKAVQEALSSDRSLGKGSLFFYNPKTATSRWLDSKETTVIIGNHVFKK